ncbi:MAG: hypothetical protein PUA81_04840 [Oscillospiraceae bacterium]|nr:hypothetical protein [Oscillospiraceae bacterium]
MILINRKALLTLLKENDIADKIKKGPVSLFWVSKSITNKNKVKVKTIIVTLHNSLVVTKYNNSVIPIHIYSLSEITKQT